MLEMPAQRHHLRHPRRAKAPEIPLPSTGRAAQGAGEIARGPNPAVPPTGAAGFIEWDSIRLASRIGDTTGATAAER